MLSHARIIVAAALPFVVLGACSLVNAPEQNSYNAKSRWTIWLR